MEKEFIIMKEEKREKENNDLKRKEDEKKKKELEKIRLQEWVLRKLLDIVS